VRCPGPGGATGQLQDHSRAGGKVPAPGVDESGFWRSAFGPRFIRKTPPAKSTNGTAIKTFNAVPNAWFQPARKAAMARPPSKAVPAESSSKWRTRRLSRQA
jgi:hypothetical protein